MVCSYIENVIIRKKKNLADDLKSLKIALQKLAESGLKENREKSLF